MHQSRTPLVRRVVASAIAAAALSTPAILEFAGHAAGQDRQVPERAVAMPDCITNWSPICDRWDVPAPNPSDHGTHAMVNEGSVNRLVDGMFDCTRHWAPICGPRH